MGRAELSTTPAAAPDAGRGLRLAVYSTATERGGAEIVTGHLLEELDPNIDVTVIGTDPAMVAWLASRRPGTPSVLVAPIGSRYQIWRMRKFRRALARLQPDVVHFVLPWVYDARWEMLVASTVRSLAVVAVEHSQIPLPSQRFGVLKRWTERRLDAHVVVSASIARELQASLRLDSLPRVIYNGIPDVAPDVVVDIVSNHPNNIVGTIARLEEIKGLDVLLRSVATLADARLIIVGRGPDETTLRRLATELGIDDRLEWVGWTDRPAEQLARFNVFVLPSRSEGLPLSICEAMVAGLPVVASDVGGVGEVVVDGETGVLVPPDNPDALAKAIETMLEDAGRRAQMGQAGQRRARAHFTASAMARSYETLYAELVTRRTTSTTSSRTMSVE